MFKSLFNYIRKDILGRNEKVMIGMINNYKIRVFSGNFEEGFNKIGKIAIREWLYD